MRSYQTEVNNNSGNLNNYVLELLLNKTRPSNITLMRLYKETNPCLLRYNALYGDNFKAHIKENYVDHISRNNFDIFLLLLCGDIESKPGPKKKASHLKKAHYMRANRSSAPQQKGQISPNDPVIYSSPSNTNSAIIGNFHQGDINKFGNNSVGKQCTCNALISLLWFTFSWQCVIIDFRQYINQRWSTLPWHAA